MNEVMVVMCVNEVMVVMCVNEVPAVSKEAPLSGKEAPDFLAHHGTLMC